MHPTLPLAEMTTAEKLELIEILWNDLSKAPEEIPSPDWHLEELRRREESVKNGTSEFLDWDDVKTRLIDSLS